VTSGFEWTAVLDIGVGLGVFLIGLGALILCSAVSRMLGRAGDTLDAVEKQLGTLSVPVVQTLGHIDGIANSADHAVARLTGVVDQLDTVAGGANRLTTLLVEAISPAVVTLGATLTGVAAGLRRFIARE
jgi:hypothetical protein